MLMECKDEVKCTDDHMHTRYLESKIRYGGVYSSKMQNHQLQFSLLSDSRADFISERAGLTSRHNCTPDIVPPSAIKRLHALIVLSVCSNTVFSQRLLESAPIGSLLGSKPPLPTKTLKDQAVHRTTHNSPSIPSP